MDNACSKCCPVCKTAWILILVGALNWGLVGLGGFVGTNLNLVNLLFGSWPVVENIVYVLVGVSAVCAIGKFCKCCKGSGA